MKKNNTRHAKKKNIMHRKEKNQSVETDSKKVQVDLVEKNKKSYMANGKYVPYVQNSSVLR